MWYLRQSYCCGQVIFTAWELPGEGPRYLQIRSVTHSSLCIYSITVSQYNAFVLSMQCNRKWGISEWHLRNVLTAVSSLFWTETHLVSLDKSWISQKPRVNVCGGEEVPVVCKAFPCEISALNSRLGKTGLPYRSLHSYVSFSMLSGRKGCQLYVRSPDGDGQGRVWILPYSEKTIMSH